MKRLNYKGAKKALQEGKKVRGKNWSNYEYMILGDDKKTLKFKIDGKKSIIQEVLNSIIFSIYDNKVMNNNRDVYYELY